jgi:hypothetical protein
MKRLLSLVVVPAAVAGVFAAFGGWRFGGDQGDVLRVGRRLACAGVSVDRRSPSPLGVDGYAQGYADQLFKVVTATSSSRPSSSAARGGTARRVR